jgi:hypothetical protein
MNKFTILMASSVKGYKPRLFDAHSPSVLVEAVKEQYQFKIAPTMDQLAQNPNGPFNFLYGKFKSAGRIIVIEQLLVTYVGVTATSVGASTKIGTDEAREFLDDLSTWVRDEYGVDTHTMFPPYYHSTVEVEFGRPLSSHLREFRDLGNLITNKVHGYGYENCPYELSGFSMHFDTTEQRPPFLGAFSIERRVGAAYGENKYFSQAPLSTQDHRDVLGAMEVMLAIE